LGTAIVFKGVTSDVNVLYKGATDFSLWLPEGLYEVSGIGSGAGLLGPFREPFRFRVTKGEIVYVGTISYGCVQHSERSKWYGLMNCGLLAMMKCSVPNPTIPMCVTDKKDGIIESFLGENPTFSSLRVNSDIMQ
jgi:hypothetical protein